MHSNKGLAWLYYSNACIACVPLYVYICIDSTAYPHAVDKSLCVYLLYSIFCLHFQCSFISRIYTVYNTPTHTYICPIVYTSMSAHMQLVPSTAIHTNIQKKPIPFGARARHSIQIFFPPTTVIFLFLTKCSYTLAHYFFKAHSYIMFIHIHGMVDIFICI